MSLIERAFLREDDGSLTVTTDATGASFERGFLRSPLGALVATVDAAGAAMRSGFLRSPSGALVMDSNGAVAAIVAGQARTASGALAVATGGGVIVERGFLRDALGKLIVTGLALPYEEQVLALAPDLYWRLNEAAGAVVVGDSSGNGNVGAYAGGVVLDQPGLLAGDKCVRLDNAGSMQANAYRPFGVAGVTRTFEVLAERTSNASTSFLFGAVNGFAVWALAGSDSISYGTSTGALVTWAGALSLNVPHHVGFVLDDAARTGRLVVDGVDLGAKVPAGGASGAGLFTLGFEAHFTAWDGYLDECAVYPGAVAVDELAAHALGAGL
jgi:hypothetical protein